MYSRVVASFYAMTIEEISSIDCRLEDGKEQLQQALYRIDPFKKYKDKGAKVPLSAIEKLIDKICRRYQVSPGYIGICVVNGNRLYYTVQAYDQDKICYLGVVSGVSLYETMAKEALLLWGKIGSKGLAKRKVTWKGED